MKTSDVELSRAVVRAYEKGKRDQQDKLDDTLRLLALAIHRLGGSMEIKLGDHFETAGLTFMSSRDDHGVGRIWLERLGKAVAQVEISAQPHPKEQKQ